MGLTVNQRPNQSNAWVATGNPILYKMIRKDFTISAIANSGGALQITVGANLATLSAALGGPVVAGSVLYFKDDGGIYAGSFTVVTCTNAANSVVTFTAGTYTSGAGAATGYVNLTSNRSSYRVEVELYRHTDNTLIFSKYEFAPAGDGSLNYMNVASALNSYVDQEPFAYLATTTNGNTIPKARRNAGSSLGFYIKYREVWNGSAESQTSDSANPAWAVKAVRQVGDPYGGYLKEYSEPNATPTRKFLTKFTGGVRSLWPGRKSLISFIDSEILSTPRTLIKKTRYNSDLTAWGATYDLPDYTGPGTRGIFEVLEDLTTPYALIYDKENGAGTSWTNLGTATPIAVTLAPAASSKEAYFPLQLLVGKTYEVTMRVTVAAGAGGDTVKVRINALTLAGTVRYTVDSANLNQGTSTDLTFSAIIPATSDTYFFSVQVIHNGGANNRTTTLDWIRVTVPVAYRVDYQIITLTNAIAATETVVSETLTHLVKELPDQPIQLVWKNSLGGDETFIFGHTQDRRIRLQDYKRPRLVCYAQFLSVTEWDSLQELNDLGEVYEVPIAELTTSVTRTHAKRGSSVYMIDASGNKTGVIVVPTEIGTKTRRIQHSIEITIELPEIQAVR